MVGRQHNLGQEGKFWRQEARNSVGSAHWNRRSEHSSCLWEHVVIPNWAGLGMMGWNGSLHKD